MGKSHMSVLMGAVLAGLTWPAWGQDSATLDRIAATATIRIGQRVSSVPFSYYSDDRRVIGYSQDIMMQIVAAVRDQLKLPALTISLAPITSQNWIPLLINGNLDMECSSTSHTVDREKKVAFSNTIFVIGTRLLTRADAGIRDFADLAQKQVVVTAGTTAERALHRFNEEHGIGMTILAVKEHDLAFQELQAGRAAAFVMDDALLYGARAEAPRPEDWIVTGTPLTREAYACTMRRDDPAFKALVDAAIARLMTSGEARALYDKWFTQPIPPNGMNLDWPISAAQAALYAAPNDRPIE
ncbi:transporter substrate-binding domain-containing protein [Paracoccus limosus]|uniref:Transporter substrate-binding domain-containing protein n=2 Tax=Paracoccus limosus TaxID=913252 RepID=A0A844H405_9RHOB|nr:transporter substrate-binding domain-containing protein [Paracoccus limosus]